MTDTTPRPDEKAPATRPARWRWLAIGALAAVTAAAFAAAAYKGYSPQHILQAVVAHRKALGAYVASHFALSLLVYAGLYVVVVALSLPGGGLMTLAGGFLFGWLAGGAAAVVGAATGALIVFLIARSTLGEALAARAGPQLSRFSEGFRRDAAAYMLFLRLVPAFPFWMVNIAAALLRVPFPTFAWTTAIGIVPATMAFAFAGSGLDSVIAGQTAAFDACIASGAADCRLQISASKLVTRELLIAFGALGALALLPVVLRRFGFFARLGNAKAGDPA